MWNYAIPLLTAVIALLQLVKDWGAHKATWRRGLVLLAIVALGIGGMVNVYINAKRANEQAATIKALTKAVETANTNQVQNTKVFTDSIERFSGKLRDLEIGVKTADLREEADHLREELAKTQKALVTPQAVLTPGIVVSPSRPDDLQLSTQLLVPNGQPVAFEISMKNISGVSARSGSFGIHICDVCKFHSEPPGFSRFHGQEEQERTLMFDRVVAGTHVPTIPIEVDVPDGWSQFNIGFRCLCENCKDNGWSIGTVSVTRLGPKAVPVKPVKPR